MLINMEKLRKIPWTVPALLLLTAFRYFSLGTMDWVSWGALALVVLRLVQVFSSSDDSQAGERGGDEQKQ